MYTNVRACVHKGLLKTCPSVSNQRHRARTIQSNHGSPALTRGPYSPHSTLKQRAVLANCIKTDGPTTGPPKSPVHHSIPDMYYQASERYGNDRAIEDPHRKDVPPLTYREMYEEMCRFGAGLQSLGLLPGDLVSQFSENSSRWLLADQGIMMNGAANAVRGASASDIELVNIFLHSESCGLVVQDPELLDRLLACLPPSEVSALKFIVLLWGEPSPTALAASLKNIHTFTQVCEAGIASGVTSFPEVKRETLATLVYTSGTTGTPKAAALSHANILFQVENFDLFIRPEGNCTVLSLLPPWHIYERAVSYYLFSRGSKQVYSSIPKFKRDLAEYQPDYLVCVPLVLDTLYSRVNASLRQLPAPKDQIVAFLMKASAAYVRARRLLQGVALQFAWKKPTTLQYISALATFLATFVFHKLAQILVYKKIRAEIGIQKSLVSGGGSLAPHLDDFFEMIDVPVINGWGLTETSPVLSCRIVGSPEPEANVRGTIGYPIRGTEFKFVDPLNLQKKVPIGEAGMILTRGPGVMLGYWKNEEARKEAFVDDWYITGDLGRMVPPGNLMSGQLILTGRAKDTIVLTGGENVEPQPIEDAICCSPIIQHAVVLGQDKRTLGCLVSLDKEAFTAHLQERGDTRTQEQISPTQLQNLLLAEVRRMNVERADRHVWEVITEVDVVSKPFTEMPGALTRTMKIRREAIQELYSEETTSVMSRLR